MRERDIERALVREVSRRGGMAPKFVSPGMDGMPDRIVMFPGGRIAFVELKAPGKRPRPLQGIRIERLEALGFRTYVLDCIDKVGEVLDEVERT